MSKNYNETLAWMYRQLPMYQRQGQSAFKKDLGNILKLLEALGNPHKELKAIHVAGTNGKGSVSHLIAGMLQIQGYRVGLYTSPHYKDFRERIKINGQMISKQHVTRFIHDHQEVIEEIGPSFFEITVALAFDYFASEAPDFVVVEVGLGGRLDSTNVITPLLSVITNIGLDHQHMLGDTLPEIATEKAGIIKAGVPVVIGEHQLETDHVFNDRSKAYSSDLIYAQDRLYIDDIQSHDDTIKIEIREIQNSITYQLHTDFISLYQRKNIITALASILVLSDQHISIRLNQEQLEQNFLSIKKKTYFIGRWQRLQTDPLVIADSAHNQDGIQWLLAQLEQMDYEQLHIVIGMVNDKDVHTVLDILPTTAHYYYCAAQIPRAMLADELRQIGVGLSLHGRSYTSVRRALANARRRASKDDLVLVAGSIFVTAEVI